MRLAETASARVMVHDVLGREIEVLWDGPLAAGDSALAWDAGRVVPGVYVVHAEAGGRVETRFVTVAR